MLTATDSFIDFLSDELSGAPPVYWWRQTAVDEHAGFLKQDALNVQLLGFFEDGSAETCLVSLDLLASDERQAMAWLKTIRNLLIDCQVIPEMDYTDPDSPVTTGRSVSWYGRQIEFINVRTPRGVRYVHYNATFPLLYVRE